MRVHKLSVLIAILSVASLGWQPASAQGSTPVKLPHTPLVVGVNNGQSLDEGDLWVLNGSQLARRTSNGHTYVPLVSPTGEWVAYQQVAPAFVKLRNPGESDSTDSQQAPTDLYLLNLKTGSQVRIAGQPPKPSFALDGSGLNTLRSQPSWSPDGNLLAWTEIASNPDLNSDQSVEQLMVYDVTTQSTETIVSPLRSHRLVTAGFPAMSRASFGPDGIIAVLVQSGLDVDPGGDDAILFYNLQGQLIAENDTIMTAENDYGRGELIWLTGEFQSYLTCIGCQTQVDPLTGKVSNIPGTSEMYSALAPDKLSLYYGSDSGNEANVTWIIALHGQQVSTFDSIRFTNITDAAISPDGMQVVGASFSGQGTNAGILIYNVRTDETIPVTTNVTGVGWGPVAWRIFPALAQF